MCGVDLVLFVCECVCVHAHTAKFKCDLKALRRHLVAEICLVRCFHPMNFKSTSLMHTQVPKFLCILNTHKWRHIIGGTYSIQLHLKIHPLWTHCLVGFSKCVPSQNLHFSDSIKHFFHLSNLSCIAAISPHCNCSLSPGIMSVWLLFLS